MHRSSIRELVKRIPSSNWPAVHFATYKFRYGQGGQCNIDLTKRSYHIEFETIWEDHCLVQVSGLTGPQSIKVSETQNGHGSINDQELEPNLGEIVHIQWKIPEDYTFNGTLQGSVSHLKNKVSNQLRTNNMSLILKGNKKMFQWSSLQCPELQMNNQDGAIDINRLTFQKGNFKCNSFSSQKVLLSEQMDLTAHHNVHVRSIVTFGNAFARIQTKFLQLESLSGKFEMSADKVRIDRVWGSPNGVNIKAKQIEKLGIQTGSGLIQSEKPVDLQKITLGKLHKGRVIAVNRNLIEIV